MEFSRVLPLGFSGGFNDFKGLGPTWFDIKVPFLNGFSWVF